MYAKNKLILSLTAMLAINSSAFAMGGSPQHDNDQNIDCKSCPQSPIESQLDFRVVRDSFANGTSPSTSELTGEWIQTLAVADPAKASKMDENSFKWLNQGSQPDGFKNADGSERNSIVFRLTQNETSDFITEDSLTYQLFGIGHSLAFQGPYLTSTRANSVCISQYAYGGGRVQKTASVEYSCKFLLNKKDRLLCEVTLRGEWNNEKNNQVVNQVIGYFGFKKKPKIQD